jgi:hypothetical protein
LKGWTGDNLVHSKFFFQTTTLNPQAIISGGLDDVESRDCPTPDRAKCIMWGKMPGVFVSASNSDLQLPKAFITDEL